MVRLFEIVVLGSTLTVLAGCGNGGEQPGYGQVKLGDLATVGGVERLGDQAIRMINLDVVTFEFPAEKLDALQDIRAMLNTNAPRSSDPNVFRANSFWAGAAPPRILQTTVDRLTAAGGSKTDATSLLIPDGSSETVNIARIARKSDISFVSRRNWPDKVNVGPGYLTLRVSAARPPGSALVCTVQVTPIFSPKTRGLTPKLAERLRANQVRFSSAAFALRMRIGDFILLMPLRPCDEPSTLCGLFFFGGASDKRTFKAYLLTCTNMS